MDPNLSSSSAESGEDVHIPDVASPVDEADGIMSMGANVTETISIVAPLGSSGVLEVPEVESDTSVPEIMSSRAYQLEMLDQSLKRNVIVAMDTGSGKTQVAVLRIKAELDKPSEKLIWFLAPTVTLCSQQYEVLKLQIESTPMKLLTGNDNLHTWSAPTWTKILKGTRLVVSTFQVLLDALSHGFINIESLGLLVIDEVHNCVGKHPGSKIMTDFYHLRKHDNRPVPAVLGLTASPVMRSKIESIDTLESTMDATCVTPNIHREELLKCVNKPCLSYSTYNNIEFPTNTESLKSLREVFRKMDIASDPYILKLQADGSDRSRRALIDAIQKHDTFSQNQMKGFCNRGMEALVQLGPWAVDHYISKAIAEFLARTERRDSFYDGWLSEERAYLAGFFGKVSVQAPKVPPTPSELSDKVAVLIQRLLSTQDPVVGIVFVKERATATLVCDILSSLPPILKKYRIGAMVGTSNHLARKKNIYEFAEAADLLSLQNFRSGKINLLVATSVLEEGIDVPACNLVICFDNPNNLKSFIQRRGRARMRKSDLVLFSSGKTSRDDSWKALEEEMKKQYQDDDRERNELELLEDSEDTSSALIEIKSTGARLDFDNAKQHLDHFCSSLSQGGYVDCRPDYIINRKSYGGKSLTATVLLPSFLPLSLRQATSSSSWASEKNATKDAAFQAYKALYDAGLVSEHLLPYKLEEIPGVEDRAPEVEVEQPWKPWKQIALAWQGTADRWLYYVSCHNENDILVGHYKMVLPIQIPQPRPIKLYIDYNIEWRLSFSSGSRITKSDSQDLPDHTSTLLALNFAHRWLVENRSHVIKLTANDDLPWGEIGSVPFDLQQDYTDGDHIIRDQAKCPFLYVGVLPSKPPADLVQHGYYFLENAPINVPYVSLKKWTRRADFLHRLNNDPAKELPSSKPYSAVLPASWITVDTIPKIHTQFGMLIPSVIHELEVMMVATELATTLLDPVGITDLQLVREAISSRSAIEPVNYERLEFLGDSILKFCAFVQASADHPNWPEGYLSLFKDRLISNSRLSRAAIVKGLSKFILSKPFTGQKWRPLYLDDLLKQESKTLPPRRLASKTLADVVESLIGASYQDGGIPKALKCISIFLDEIKWHDEGSGRQILLNLVPSDTKLPSVLRPLEELMGYSFQRKALLVEAMTHASYVADSQQRSLERLEFLGDAVLDNIIVTKLFSLQPSLPHYQMHLLKTVMVNGDFLAFVGLEHRLRQTEFVVNRDGEIEEKETFLPLWSFMRHASPAIGLEHAAMTLRFKDLRHDILAALERGTHYPWASLARLQAKKFYSDLFEALLGAVWIDSGSLEVCEAVLERFGIMTYLDRILRDNVHVKHPKEELGTLAIAETVNYAYEVLAGADGEKEYRCKVHVGQRLVAEVQGGVDKEEVKTKAAEEADSINRPLQHPLHIPSTPPFNTLYAFAGLSTLLYGSSKYLLGPMVDTQTEARLDFHATTAAKLDALVTKLESTVSEVPAAKKLAALGDDESDVDDPSEMFHRDMGTQTSLPLSVAPTMGKDAGGDATAAQQKHVDGVVMLSKVLSGFKDDLRQQTEDMEDIKTLLDVLRDDVDGLTYGGQSEFLAGYDMYGRSRNAEPEDEIRKVRDNIRRVKGVLLSTRNFPSSTR
ncbi:hypothetical protein G7046_g1039 [Stylonectria norvegica]|nr:hypothetical protein G7046_g1039 [Stylonectria norvegica]